MGVGVKTSKELFSIHTAALSIYQETSPTAGKKDETIKNYHTASSLT